MPRKAISVEDLFTDLADRLREQASVVGLSKYVPMPKQAEFHKCTKKGRIYSGGNRGGKTVAGAVEAVKWATGQHEVYSKIFPPPVRGRIVAVDFDRGVDLIVLPEVKKWIDPKYLIDGSWAKSYHKASRILTLNNGSIIEFMSFDQDPEKFVGTSRHFVWFDEEVPKAIFTECLARLIDTDGHWWLTLTPLQDFSWTADVLYEPARNGDLENVALFEVDTRENYHLKAEAIESNMALMDEDEREARLAGSGYAQTSLIYGTITDNVIDELDGKRWENVKNNWTHFTMMDHGYRNPTAILFGAVGPEQEVIIYDEIYVAGNLVRDNAKLYKERVAELGIKVKYMVGDPSTKNTDPINGASVMMEYNQNGVWYMLANNDVHAGIVRVQGRLKNKDLFITRNCVHLLKEARKYKWSKPISSKSQSRNNLHETPVKKDDHAMDALRYGIMSLPRNSREVDEQRRRELEMIIPVATTASVYNKATIERDLGDYDEHLGYV